ncbi:MAG: peptidylprolyl isomerase [Bacteroidota bacterium]
MPEPRHFLLLFVLFPLTGCLVPPEEGAYDPARVVVDLNDPVSRRVYDHQNARRADSLLYYLGHPGASYRYLAARAFGSFPELTEEATDSLAGRLRDRDELVRAAAAFALGQSGQKTVAPTLAAAFDTLGRMPDYNAAVLTAVGKTGDQQLLNQVTAITTYTEKDTLLRAGQVWSIFHFGLRKLRSPAADSLLLGYLVDPTTPPAVLEAATGFLQRFPVTVSEQREEALRQQLRTNENPDVLMAVVRTLGRAATPTARVALLRALRTVSDWRVRTEIIRGLNDFAYASVREPIMEALKDKHPLVRRAAANYLLNNGTANDATFYRRLARDSTGTRDIRFVLYAAANRHLPNYLTDYRGFINFDLQQAFAATSDPYEQGEILTALGEFSWNYRTVYEYYRQASHPAVRSAAADALSKISQREDFDVFFRASARRVRLDLAGYFREMIYGREVGPAYAAANTLQKQAPVYRPFYPELDWMNTALRGFALPKEIETYRAVDAARAALAGEEEPVPYAAEAEARPIDWDLIGTDAGKEVVFRVPQGRITLQLYPDKAPATVSSFLQLVGEGYYDGKVFHRVVPNFVAQGGGPRGDGFGSEDFVIRTETPGIGWGRPGLIGMASAGKDTEGVQFFFTHRPTPHLNGGYTIFGEVTDGQDVVDQLTVGTTIESIQLR